MTHFFISGFSTFLWVCVCSSRLQFSFAVLDIDVVVARADAVVAGVDDLCDSMVIFSSGALKSVVFLQGGV